MIFSQPLVEKKSDQNDFFLNRTWRFWLSSGENDFFVLIIFSATLESDVSVSFLLINWKYSGSFSTYKDKRNRSSFDLIKHEWERF